MCVFSCGVTGGECGTFALRSVALLVAFEARYCLQPSSFGHSKLVCLYYLAGPPVPLAFDGTGCSLMIACSLKYRTAILVIVIVVVAVSSSMVGSGALNRSPLDFGPGTKWATIQADHKNTH